MSDKRLFLFKMFDQKQPFQKFLALQEELNKWAYNYLDLI